MLRKLQRFTVVACEQPLIEALLWQQHRLTAQHCFKKGELRNISTEDDKAHGDRSSEHQTNRSPQGRPEDRRDQYSESRYAGARPIEARLNRICGHELERT